jgi:Protein of unknown function (DUF4238)
LAFDHVQLRPGPLADQPRVQLSRRDRIRSPCDRADEVFGKKKSKQFSLICRKRHLSRRSAYHQCAMAEGRVPGPFADYLEAVARGERELPNCDGERHHYNPQFVLKKFRGPGGRLFQLDKTDGSCSPIRVKDAAWDPNLYTIDSETGEHDGIVEGFFSLAENFASDSLARLLRSQATFTDDDRGNLAFLLASQEQRAPGWLEEFEERIAQMGTMWATVQLANLSGPKVRQRKAREAAQALADGRVTIRPTKSNLLSTALMGIASTVSLVYALPWTLFRAKNGVFVTSDRPLTMHDPTPPHKFAGAAWLSSDLAVVTMPLSSTTCLRVCPSDRSRLAHRETTKQVDRINLRTYGWAQRYIYGSSAEALEDLHARALANPGDVPLPTKKRSVMLEDIATADPTVADDHAANGLPRYVSVRDKDGSFRLVSYELIDSMDDARRAVAPRAVRPGDDERHWASAIENLHPLDVHRP